MRSITRGVAAVVLSSLAVASVAVGEEKPLITDVKYTESRAATFFYFSERTTIKKMQQTVGKRVEQALVDMTKAGVTPLGPSQFIYRGADGNPDTEFELRVGWAVAEGTKPTGEYKVEALPAAKVATLIYGGPLSKLMDAYGKLLGQVMADGKQPAGETREIYAYWVDVESSDNVTILQALIK